MARKIGSRYTAHRILGRGSAGTVWLGEGPDGPVALKLLREDLASDQDLAERFVQERGALLGLDHPRIVGVHDLVVDGNDLALVMQLVRGTDLRTRLEHERRLAPEAAVAIAADVAEALAAAHAAGIVHRDVKPENVLLDALSMEGPGGAPPALLTDFGVAKLIDSPSRTRATSIIGTPDYLAPEIVEGLPPRAAVDIYALATVLYELLAGFTPFGGGHPGAVLRRHVTESVAPLPGIPDELWQLIHQCLAKAPASRLRAPELAARLRELLPAVAGIPPLDIDEQSEDGYEAEQPDAAAERSGAAGADAAAVTGAHAASADGPPAGAVPLVHGGAGPDANRDTHTSMRVPGADELAGGAHGTARAPRASGEPRAGSARNRSGVPVPVQRRRLKVGAAAVLVALVVAVGGWLASSDEETGSQPSPAAEYSSR
ncbi:serine/threonine-protein kinase [Streptomyces cacaoi]|uniref:serine/threonine-protein kinase n=1 Tax=Streptomyces cacaoi TaxID=1898 RepID=UPI002606877A|nr:serine/threonine-protein kinase [Streptomyces cacaoi]